MRPAILSRWVRGPTIDFRFGEFAVREDRALENRDRVAVRMPEDYSFVKNQVGFINRHLLLGYPRPTRIHQILRRLRV